jgi:hypothetical protein
LEELELYQTGLQCLEKSGIPLQRTGMFASILEVLTIDY